MLIVRSLHTYSYVLKSFLFGISFVFFFFKVLYSKNPFSVALLHALIFFIFSHEQCQWFFFILFFLMWGCVFLFSYHVDMSQWDVFFSREHNEFHSFKLCKWFVKGINESCIIWWNVLNMRHFQTHLQTPHCPPNCRPS